MQVPLTLLASIRHRDEQHQSARKNVSGWNIAAAIGHRGLNLARRQLWKKPYLRHATRYLDPMPIDRLIKSAAWLSLVAILFVTICPIDLRPHTMTEVGSDRAGAFAVMALLFVSAYPRHWKSIAILLALSAPGLELLQALSPTRHARFDDALVKAAGVLAGATAARVLFHLAMFLSRRMQRAEGDAVSPGAVRVLDLGGAENAPSAQQA